MSNYTEALGTQGLRYKRGWRLPYCESSAIRIGLEPGITDTGPWKKHKGVVDQNRKVKYRYLLDENEWQSFVNCKGFPFADELEQRSEKLGVRLKREKGGRKSLLSFTNSNQLRLKLKGLENDLNCLTVIITSK